MAWLNKEEQRSYYYSKGGGNAESKQIGYPGEEEKENSMM